MTGRALPPSSAFQGDDGSADPRLAGLLAGHASGTASLVEVVAALASARVLVPVLAELEAADETPDGHVVDKEASAGVVALEAPDGRRALPVFSSVDTMKAWRPTARPVPVEAPRAALSAVSEDWSLLVVDPAGPFTVLVPRPAVWALAKGLSWSPAVVDGVVADDVVEAIRLAAAPVAHVLKVGAEPGRRAEVAVALTLDAGLDRANLDKTLAAVNARLAASDVIGERVDSLEMRISAGR